MGSTREKKSSSDMEFLRTSTRSSRRSTTSSKFFSSQLSSLPSMPTSSASLRGIRDSLELKSQRRKKRLNEDELNEDMFLKEKSYKHSTSVSCAKVFDSLLKKYTCKALFKT